MTPQVGDELISGGKLSERPDGILAIVAVRYEKQQN
jgi:hypothetical protein